MKALQVHETEGFTRGGDPYVKLGVGSIVRERIEKMAYDFGLGYDNTVIYDAESAYYAIKELGEKDNFDEELKQCFGKKWEDIKKDKELHVKDSLIAGIEAAAEKYDYLDYEPDED